MNCRAQATRSPAAVIRMEMLTELFYALHIHPTTSQLIGVTSILLIWGILSGLLPVIFFLMAKGPVMVAATTPLYRPTATCMYFIKTRVITKPVFKWAPVGSRVLK